MKNLLFAFFVLITFYACQDEVTEVTEPTEEENIEAGSSLALRIQNTTSNDGSPDNIIDGANCLSINLPVTVVVNGLEIIIDSEEDYEVIEAIFDEFDGDDDSLEIVFPITIILNDYTEITIESYDELEEFIDECSGENELDDDIECIDFVYPFTVSIFNTDFQVIDTITIESDSQLYAFIDELDGSLLAGINYPVNMELFDGTIIQVNNNTELLNAIENADDTCDEDDDNDYGDDDTNDIPVDDFIDFLTNCTWFIDDMEIDDEDLEDYYEGFEFSFNANGTIEVVSETDTYSGTWEIVDGAAGIQISINIPELPACNNDNWILHEIEDYDDEFSFDLRNGEDRVEYELIDCSEEEDSLGCLETSPIVQCDENNDGVEVFNLYEGLSDIDDCTITNPVMVSYHTSLSDAETNSNPIASVTSFSNTSNPQTVYVRIELISSPNEFEILEMGLSLQDCSGSGSVEDLEAIIVEGNWVVASYIDSGENSTAEYSNYSLNFNMDGTVTATDGGSNTFYGNWEVFTSNNGDLKLLLDFENQVPFDEFNDDWLVIDLQTNRIELYDLSGGDGTEDFLVFERI